MRAAVSSSVPAQQKTPAAGRNLGSPAQGTTQQGVLGTAGRGEYTLNCLHICRFLKMRLPCLPAMILLPCTDHGMALCL